AVTSSKLDSMARTRSSSDNDPTNRPPWSSTINWPTSDTLTTSAARRMVAPSRIYAGYAVMTSLTSTPPPGSVLGGSSQPTASRDQRRATPSKEALPCPLSDRSGQSILGDGTQTNCLMARADGGRHRDGDR